RETLPRAGRNGACRIGRPRHRAGGASSRRLGGDDPEPCLRSRKAPSVPGSAPLLPLPVSGFAGPAGRAPLRRLRRLVRDPRDDRADPDGARPPGGRGLTMAACKREGLKTWLRHLPAFLGVALLIGAIYVVQREFRHLRLKDIGEALGAIPSHSLMFSFI